MEATVRYAAELGYEATMAKDATADYSDEEMHAALDVNIPNYANAIVTTDEIVASILLSKLSRQFYILKDNGYGGAYCSVSVDGGIESGSD